MNTETAAFARPDEVMLEAPSLHDRLQLAKHHQHSATSAAALTDRPGMSAAYHAGAEPGAHPGNMDWASFPTVNRSADADIIPAKDTAEARIKDLTQNGGYDRGAMLQHVAGIVGPDGLKLSSRPDWRAIPGGTEEWAREFARTLESRWRSFIGSDRNSLDVARLLNWAAINSTVTQSLITHGEIAASFEPRRNPKTGEMQTAIRVIDPSRISDPEDNKAAIRDRDIRGGIEYSASGEAVAAWIASRHKGDLPSRGGTVAQRAGKLTWKRHPFYSPRTGRRVVFYALDPERPEQTRGISPLVAAVKAAKLIDNLSDATLRAAVLQATFAAVVKSTADWKDLVEILGAKDPADADSSGFDAVRQYMNTKAQFYSRNPATLSGHRAKLVHLLPEEELEIKAASSGSVEVAAFLKEMRAEVASAHSLGLEAYSGDWSKTSFSSAKMSTQQTARIQAGRRSRAVVPFCQWVFGSFVEKLLVRDPGLLPAEADFWTDRDAILRGTWAGPPAMEPDPLKAAKASTERLNSGTSTLERESALIGGDWEEDLEQRARELRRKEELDLFRLEALDSAAKTTQAAADASGVDVDGDDDDDDDDDGQDGNGKNSNGGEE